MNSTSSSPPTATVSHPRLLMICAALVAAIGGLLFGFDTVAISGANAALQSLFQLSEFWQGFTVAIAMIGTIVGAFAVGKPSDWLGRKRVLFVLAACFVVSSLGCGLARDWWEFISFRFIAGLAIGGASMVTPMYIAEISPPRMRGRLVMVNQLNIVVGVLLAFVSNYVISRCCPANEAWRWMLGVLALPAGVFFFLIFAVPESPRYLVKKGRSAEARRVLERLGGEDAEGELAAIEASLTDRPGHVQERLFHAPHWRPVLLAAAVAMFNQFTGINAILYYAPKIIGTAGATAEDSLWRSVPLGLTLLAFTIVAMFVIDRFGRRILLLIGSVGMAVCLGLVAAAFAHHPARHEWLILGGLIGSIAFFAMSQGAVMFVFISEIFPNAVRAKGQAFGTLVHWSMAAVVTQCFPLAAKYSVASVFAFFSAMMVLQLFFAWRIMPETKGAALEEMEQRLAS